MNRAKKTLVMFDPHFGFQDDGSPGHDEEAFATFLRAIGIVRPDAFLLGGDFGEWSSVSPWQFKRRKRPDLDYTLERLDEELVEVNSQLDRIDAALAEVGCKEKIMIEGNHEVWVREMVSESKLATAAYDLNLQCRLSERGYGKMVPYGKYIQLGKLHVYHGGHYMSIHHAYTHATKCGASVMYGHGHDIQAVTVPSIEGPHGGFAMGCMCAMEKGFLKGRKTNWQHAFGVVHTREDGKFLVQTYRIEDGWTVVDGKEIDCGRLRAGRPRKENA
jgi:hypothetical protein